ncbi:hypothetical protein GPX89_16705 [Nocardia sp. ET3-3]|uniref:Uncharacterized protein n=1 Tax=Nocardia terrae TaxID=2675851 RepID=A0A7K1UWW9_9NOCA|nr:hypothetical protein [Nocardia terrae]MVU78880.1 hypothetical protein [Nocardia terrae]
MSFDPTGKSVDQILDYGAPGLQYWEQFLPLYAKAFGAPHGLFLTDLYARYDEQRGTRLAEFDTARAELDRALADAETRWSAQQSVAHSLPAAWTGPTGDEALTIVNSQLRQAREDLDTAHTATAAISAALEPLRHAVLTKAEVTLALLEPTRDGEGRVAIDGKTAEDIEDLVSDGSDPWLTATFRPDIERKLTTFTAACDTADRTFDSHYRTILTAFAQVIDHPYPQPAQTLLPRPDPDLSPSSPTAQPVPAPRSYPAQSQLPAAGFGQTPQQPAYSLVPAETPGAAESARASAVPEGEPREPTHPASTVPEALPGPATTPPATSESAVSTPSTADAADPSRLQSDQFTRSATTVFDQLESALQQGISTALEKLGSLTGQQSPSATPGSTPDAPEPEPKPDSASLPNLPTGRLEFDLAGNHFILERTPVGELTLTMTDQSGRTHTLTLNQNGTPTLPDGDSTAPHDNPTTADPAGDTPTSRASAPDQPPPAVSAPPDPSGLEHPAPQEASPPTAGTDRNAPGCPCPQDAQITPTRPPEPAADCQPANPPTPALRSGPDQAAQQLPPSSAVCQPPHDQGPATPACDPSPLEPGVPTPSPDPPGPLDVSPPTPAPTPPSSGSEPPQAASPSIENNVPTELPANPPPSLGSPDAPLEIPEGGVEIPELSPLVESTTE